MANDNETVAEIVKRVRRECNSLPLPNAAGDKLKLVREIDAAHKRELAEKDAEIEKLNEKLTLHDCWADEECEDADAARACAELEAEELRDRIANLEAENASIRALVGEMSDALLEMNDWGCLVCASRHNSDCESGDFCDRKVRNNALIAKAREVMK